MRTGRMRAGMRQGLSGPGGPEIELRRRIGEKGPVTFAEFMDVALYFHDGGYYVTAPDETKRWGKEGDYLTSIDVSPAFPRVLSKEIHEMWTVLGSPDSFEVIEAGAGRGWLSKGILEALKESFPELYRVIRATAVEINPHLSEPGAEKLTWQRDLSGIGGGEGGGGGGITGVIISNELIDSLPVHRVIERDGLKELYVGFDGSSFLEVEGPPSTDALKAYLDRLGINLAEGERAEINLKAGEWIRRAGRLIKKGFVITIDYGLPARELYVPERRDGTLLCHYRHTINDNPFINIGRQDMTSHVDFTTLALVAEEAGLKVTGFTTQKNFLLGLGILEDLKRVETPGALEHDSMNFNRALASLIAPGGMGDTFKVLVQHKGIERPALKGFSFKDMTRFLGI